MLQTIINLLAGAAGGNAAAGLSKNLSLGPVLNSILGLAGGWLGGTAVHSLANFGDRMDAGSIIGSIVSSGAAGAILTGIVGFIKNQMGK